MTTVPLQEAWHALGVNQTTLYRWLAKAGITPEQDTIDTRKKLLTIEQLQRLASEHAKQLPTIYRRPSATYLPTKSESSIVTNDVSRLRTEIDEIKARMDSIEQKIETLLEASQQATRALPSIVTEPVSRLETVTLANFAELHGIKESTYKRHTQDVGAHKGPGGMWYLDTSGRAAFYQWAHTRQGFKKCADCPHSV